MANLFKVDRARVELEMGRREWRQRTLADAIGVSQSTISDFMRGKNVNPRLGARIAKAFGLTVDDLLRPKGRAA